jgi:putative acetyltransferase
LNLNLRTATLSDLPELQELFVNTIKNTCKQDYNEAQIKAWVSGIKKKDRWEVMIERQFVIIAEKEGEIIGFGSLDGGDYLDFLYVHHDYIGRGIATTIFIELQKKSNRLGHLLMRSDVSITARPFFEKMGFKVVRKNVNIIDGVEIINYHMSQ